MNKSYKIAFTLLTITLVVSGCFSLSYDFKGGITIDPNIKSFSVQYFDNKARLVEPSFSQRFTEGLRDHFQSNTSLRYVNGIGDIDFAGTITTYSITPQAITSGDKAALTRFTIAIKVKYSNTIVPEDDFEKTFSRFRDFESSKSFSSVEQSLSDEIIEELIDDIFNQAFVNW